MNVFETLLSPLPFLTKFFALKHSFNQILVDHFKTNSKNIAIDEVLMANFQCVMTKIS